MNNGMKIVKTKRDKICNQTFFKTFKSKIEI